MRSVFPGLSLPTMRDVTASDTRIFSYFAYSYASHIPAYVVHHISGDFAPVVGHGAWPKPLLTWSIK
jgi:hypothetical protein